MANAKVIRLPYCPRCLEHLDGMMTRARYGVLWCYLCSFDLEEDPASQREHYIRVAKERAEEEEPFPF